MVGIGNAIICNAGSRDMEKAKKRKERLDARNYVCLRAALYRRWLIAFLGSRFSLSLSLSDRFMVYSNCVRSNFKYIYIYIYIYIV